MEAYLDNAATTRAFPEVVEMVSKVMVEDYGNPSSLHGKGVDAERIIRDAADEIAVAAFLDGKIKFTDIPKIIEKTIEKEFAKGNSFEEVFYTDSEARKFASALVR